MCSSQVRFPRGTDLEREFTRVGQDWPVWWAIPDMTHLVEKARILDFVGPGRSECPGGREVLE